MPMICSSNGFAQQLPKLSIDPNSSMESTTSTFSHSLQSADGDAFTMTSTPPKFASEQEVLSSVVQSNSHFSMRLRRDYEEIVESGRNSVTSHLCTGHSWIHQQFPLAWLVQIRERGAYFDVHVAFPAEFPFKSPVLFWPPSAFDHLACDEPAMPLSPIACSAQCKAIDMGGSQWSCGMSVFDWLLLIPPRSSQR